MIRRVLLVMDDCGAGDALRLSPHVNAVRQAFPTAEVKMIASEGAAHVYRGSPAVDRVIESGLYRRGIQLWRGRALKLLELCRLSVLAGGRHDLVIVFWWSSRMLALLARLAGSGPRIGYGSHFTTDLGRYDFDGDEMELNTRLLQAAGITGPPSPLPTLTVSAEAKETAARLLRASGWDGWSSVVLLHPGSDWACQQWLPERWSEVADGISDADTHLVFTGAAAERSAIESIRRLMRGRSANLAGATSIEELAALAAQSRLVVTVDSAAYVVACSQDVPVVVLAGASHPERTTNRSRTLVVKRMTEERAREISVHRRAGYAAGGCRVDTCPFPGMQELAVADVMEAVRNVQAPAMAYSPG